MVIIQGLVSHSTMEEINRTYELVFETGQSLQAEEEFLRVFCSNHPLPS